MRNAITLGLVLMFSAILASSASSQTVEANTPQSDERVSPKHVNCSMTTGPVHVSLRSEPGAPYSATEEFSAVQTLIDGTHITPKPRTSKTYRDSQGRTREERSFCGPASDDNEAVIVTIRDPVAGVGYILDLQKRIAHRFTVSPEDKPRAASGISGSVSGTSSSVRTTIATTVTNPPGFSLSVKPRPSEESEPLGMQTIEGLAAEGTRTTETIPVNAQDNDKEMKIVTETWLSTDLNTTILRKTSDPRSGEYTWRLVDINLSEPDPALFQPPADFKVTDDTGPVSIVYSR
jgi:hypothetical protein